MSRFHAAGNAGGLRSHRAGAPRITTASRRKRGLHPGVQRLCRSLRTARTKQRRIKPQRTIANSGAQHIQLYGSAHPISADIGRCGRHFCRDRRLGSADRTTSGPHPSEGIHAPDAAGGFLREPGHARARNHRPIFVAFAPEYARSPELHHPFCGAVTEFRSAGRAIITALR